MLKNKLWIVALLVALTMAYVGCTNLGGLDDGSAPVAAEDLVITGADIVLKACGSNSSKVAIDGNKVTLDGNNTGFYYEFPAAAADYAQVQIFFKIVAIIDGRPGLLIKRNTSFGNAIGITSNEDPAYQLNDTATSGKEGFPIKPGFNFTVGMEFDTGVWKTNQFDNMMAFQNQIYNPSGNDNAKWTVEVTKVVFPGGGTVEVIPPPSYTGTDDVVYNANGSGRVDDTLVHTNPSIIGDHGMTISSTGVVTMGGSDTIMKYKFPTTAKVGATSTTRAVNVADFDNIEFSFTITDVDKSSGGTGSFKVYIRLYDGATAYGVNPGGGDYQNYTNFGATGSNPVVATGLQTWGAYGSEGLTIVYNYYDRNGDGADSMKVKLDKVTFTNAQRWKVTLYDGDSAGVTYDVIQGNTLSKSAIPASVLAPTKAGYKFSGWVTTPGGSTAVGAITTDTAAYASWTVEYPETKPDLSKVSTTDVGTGTLFIAADSYAGGTPGATYTYDGKSWWIVADARTTPCWDNPVAPFDTEDNTDLAAIKTAQGSYGSLVGYTRIGFNIQTATDFSAIVSANNLRWYDKVTITYDMRAISGADPLNVRFLNDASAAANGFGYPNLEPGDGKTVTYNLSQFSNGIGITKNNVGAMLLRITKIELEQE